MRRKSFIAVAFLILGIGTGFVLQQPKSMAEVEQYQGLYVFTDSKPVTEYEYLGTVNLTGAFGSNSTQYVPVRDRLIKKAKSEYPEGEGILLILKAGGTDRADVIKFK